VGAPPTDEELVEGYLGGRAEAFEELVRRHEGRVYAVCMRMLGREEDARDAAQDAFLQVLRKLSQFRGDAAFGTWLHRIAVNACYDQLRKKARQPVLHLAVDDDRGPEPEPGPPIPDHAEDVVGGIDVQRALLEVPVDFRAVLVLHDVQDLGYEEIAAILDVPVGTVKSRLHRGRIALGKAMGLAPSGEPGPAARPSEERP
jgi:RNA polymerase sigma-70 factor (ECF subfamily)